MMMMMMMAAVKHVRHDPTKYILKVEQKSICSQTKHEAVMTEDVRRIAALFSACMALTNVKKLLRNTMPFHDVMGRSCAIVHYSWIRKNVFGFISSQRYRSHLQSTERYRYACVSELKAKANVNRRCVAVAIMWPKPPPTSLFPTSIRWWCSHIIHIISVDRTTVDRKMTYQRRTNERACDIVACISSYFLLFLFNFIIFRSLWPENGDKEQCRRWLPKRNSKYYKYNILTIAAAAMVTAKQHPWRIRSAKKIISIFCYVHLPKMFSPYATTRVIWSAAHSRDFRT